MVVRVVVVINWTEVAALCCIGLTKHVRRNEVWCLRVYRVHCWLRRRRLNVRTRKAGYPKIVFCEETKKNFLRKFPRPGKLFTT